MPKLLQVDVQDGVATVLMNNPPINGLVPTLLDEVMATLETLGRDPKVRAIILGSAIAGRFCGGLDLPKFRRSAPTEVHELVDRLYRQLHELQASLPKPTIAAIAGSVRGGGMSMAITCDMLVAAETANFGYPEMEVGLLPAIHYTHLPRIVGRYRAFDLLFTGRVFSARKPGDRAGQQGRARGAGARGGTQGRASAGREVARADAPGQGCASPAPSTTDIDKAPQCGRPGVAVFGTAACREGLAAFEENAPPNGRGILWRTTTDDSNANCSSTTVVPTGAKRSGGRVHVADAR